jgi:hypothetical protein
MNCCEEDVERRTWEIHFIEKNLRELKQKHNCVSCLHHFDDTLWCELDYSRSISCLCIKMSLAWLLDQVALRIRFFLSQPQMSMELENHYCGLCSAYLLRNEEPMRSIGYFCASLAASISGECIRNLSGMSQLAKIGLNSIKITWSFSNMSLPGWELISFFLAEFTCNLI